MSDTTPTPGDAEPLLPSIDTSVPHSARVWNYWLGGKDNYPIDREIGDQALEISPVIAEVARAERAFLVRVVTYLVEHAGLRQFLDIGTGMPTHNNTHQVAQAHAPESRVVYVDNDPLVPAHAQTLLVGAEQGATDYIHADAREPQTIVNTAANTLDFTRPIGLVMLGILGLIADDEAPRVARQLIAALPGGSYVAICDGTNVLDETYQQATRRWNEAGSVPYHLRSPERIAGFFDGLELLEPGVVSCPWWRPEPSEVGTPREVDLFGGLAHKPSSHHR